MSKPYPMTPTEFHRCLELAGFKDRQRKRDGEHGYAAFSAWDGCHRNTPAEYGSGRRPIPSDKARLLRVMVEHKLTPEAVDAIVISQK